MEGLLDKPTTQVKTGIVYPNGNVECRSSFLQESASIIINISKRNSKTVANSTMGIISFYFYCTIGSVANLDIIISMLYIDKIYKFVSAVYTGQRQTNACQKPNFFRILDVGNQ